MTHSTSIKDIYNGLVNKYQFDNACLSENQTPESTRCFRMEKMREHLTHQLDTLSGFAYDLGEHDLAASIMRTAADLGTDCVSPAPLQ